MNLSTSHTSFWDAAEMSQSFNERHHFKSSWLEPTPTLVPDNFFDGTHLSQTFDRRSSVDTTTTTTTTPHVTKKIIPFFDKPSYSEGIHPQPNDPLDEPMPLRGGGGQDDDVSDFVPDEPTTKRFLTIKPGDILEVRHPITSILNEVKVLSINTSQYDDWIDAEENGQVSGLHPLELDPFVYNSAISPDTLVKHLKYILPNGTLNQIPFPPEGPGFISFRDYNLVDGSAPGYVPFSQRSHTIHNRFFGRITAPLLPGRDGSKSDATSDNESDSSGDSVIDLSDAFTGVSPMAHNHQEEVCVGSPPSLPPPAGAAARPPTPPPPPHMPLLFSNKIVSVLLTGDEESEEENDMSPANIKTIIQRCGGTVLTDGMNDIDMICHIIIAKYPCVGSELYTKLRSIHEDESDISIYDPALVINLFEIYQCTSNFEEARQKELHFIEKYKHFYSIFHANYCHPAPPSPAPHVPASLPAESGTQAHQQLGAYASPSRTSTGGASTFRSHDLLNGSPTGYSPPKKKGPRQYKSIGKSTNNENNDVEGATLPSSVMSPPVVQRHRESSSEAIAVDALSEKLQKSLPSPSSNDSRNANAATGSQFVKAEIGCAEDYDGTIDNDFINDMQTIFPHAMAPEHFGNTHHQPMPYPHLTNHPTTQYQSHRRPQMPQRNHPHYHHFNQPYAMPMQPHAYGPTTQTQFYPQSHYQMNPHQSFHPNAVSNLSYLHTPQPPNSMQMQPYPPNMQNVQMQPYPPNMPMPSYRQPAAATHTAHQQSQMKTPHGRPPSAAPRNMAPKQPPPAAMYRNHPYEIPPPSTFNTFSPNSDYSPGEGMLLDGELLPPTPENYYNTSPGYFNTEQLQGSPQAQVGGLYSKLPPEIKHAYRTFNIMPDCCVAINNVHSIGSSKPSEYTSEENRAVHGVNGFVTTYCPIYSKTRSSVATKGAETKGLEVVNEYGCKGNNCGCNFGMKVCRVFLQGGNVKGLVAFQKCTTDPNGTKIPIPHTDHNKLPFYHALTLGEKKEKSKQEQQLRNSKKYTPTYPSIAQQEYIAKQYKKGQPWSRLINAMLNDPTVPCHPIQEQDREGLKTTLKNYVNHNRDYLISTNKAQGRSLEETKTMLNYLTRRRNSTDNERAQPLQRKIGCSIDPELVEKINGQLHVLDHNYGDDQTGKFYILACPNDATEIAKEASKAYPGGMVQLEIDFFHPRKGVNYQVGHIGVSDYGHHYWLLALIICESENENSALRLLEAAVDLIEAADGAVEFVLVDGGTALKAAIDTLNVSRLENEKSRVVLRACFTHKMRLPGSRGGGYRGGKGSIPRGLLDRSVSNKDMGKIMSLLFDFNYLPPDDAVVYENAVGLFFRELENVIPPAAIDYLKGTINGKHPEQLGGRAVGRQGMGGSTQGLERAGGWCKAIFDGIVTSTSPEDEDDPIILLTAASDQLSGRAAPSTFASSPIVSADNYSIIVNVGKSRKKSKHLSSCTYSDFAYMQVTSAVTDNTTLINLKDVIGSGTSYTVNIPSSTHLYTQMRKMIMENNGPSHAIEFITFQEQQMASNLIDTSKKDHMYWAKQLVTLGVGEQIELFKRIENSFLEWVTKQPRGNEDTRSFLDRHAQRLAKDKKRTRHCYSKAKKKGKNSKRKNVKGNDNSVMSLEQKKAIQDNVDKWQLTDGDPSDDGPALCMGDDPVFDPDACTDELLNLFPEIDENEKETLKMIQKEEVVKTPRQLGHFITIRVNSQERKVHCNCEKCNADGRCYWVDTFEAIEFGIVADANHLIGGDAVVGFNNMVQQTRDVMKHHHLRPKAFP